MIVQKFGGSSVGTPEKIKAVAARIARARQAGNSVVVVVSAMGDTTDELLELAAKVSPAPPAFHQRELDVLLSAGERISMALLSMALKDLGQEAISFTGSQAGIITDESHTRARILEIRPIRVQEELSRGKVVIVAGFQGVSRAKEITTLGRGGSDTTAVALAAALAADRCEVFTDVPGIFSADPRIVPGARRYERLPLELVHEMAVKGAQVMHSRSIEIARHRGFPIFVGLAHPPGQTEQGTLLVPEKEMNPMELPKIVAVTSKTGLTEARFETQDAFAILDDLSQTALPLHNFDWSVPPGKTHGTLRLLLDPTEAAPFLARQKTAIQTPKMASVTLVGYQLQNNAELPGKILGALKSLGIEAAGLTSHPSSFTVWFPDGTGDKTAQAVRLLHEKFAS